MTEICERARSSAAHIGTKSAGILFVASAAERAMSSNNTVSAALALPWATESIRWKRYDFHRSDASSASAYVLSRMRADILSAYFSPGSKLPLKVLMARYETSIMPVREALAVLCGAGLVLAESQRGFRVAPASRIDLLDLTETRQRIEGMALRLSIAHADRAWLYEVQDVAATFARVSQKVGQDGPISDEWEALHREFHFALIARCGSPTLLNFCSQLHDRYDRYRRLVLPSKSYMAGVAGDHDEIKDAALLGDADRAVALLERHIQLMSEVLLGQYVH
jgi:GntR family transcriptional regulator, carbon starvation induced regulator